MSTLIQNNFSGGINQQADESKLSESEYALLINGRVRKNSIEAIALPKEIASAAITNKNLQGIYAYGEYLLVFAYGEAYYASAAGAPGSELALIYIRNYTMSQTAKRIYAEGIPAATMQLSRKLSNPANKLGGVALVDPVTGNPAVLVVQDGGESQPALIFSDGTARKAKSYGEWTYENPEYIPKGREMLYNDGKLYIVAPSRKALYHSVTGRPSDFMVIVDQNGQKLPTELEGTNANVAHSVGFANVTSLLKVGSAESGSFMVGTTNDCVMVVPDFANTIYGEPTFANRPAGFETGPINQFSIASINGDTTYIDRAGVRSFNAIMQFRNRGRNSPFTKRVSKLLANIAQLTDSACCQAWDNYVLYAVQTTLGPGVLVYDTLLDTFVSLDLYPGVKAIKQFAVTQVNDNVRIFFITEDNKLYEGFVGEQSSALLVTADFVGSNPRQAIQPKLFVGAFTEIKDTSGVVQLTIIADRIHAKTFYQQIPFNNLQAINANADHLDIAQALSQLNGAQLCEIDIATTRCGWRHCLILSWTAGTKLSHIMMEGAAIAGIPSLSQQAALYARTA